MKTTRILTLVTVFVLLFSVSSAVSEKVYSPVPGVSTKSSVPVMVAEYQKELKPSLPAPDLKGSMLF